MLKNRKTPTDHRQGTLIRLVDVIQRLYEIRHEDDFFVFDGDMASSGHINEKYQDEIEDIMQELNLFDSTKIGNLYFTSGGRIVLDKGWGEYFDKSDTVLFTLKELTSGMPAKIFIERIKMHDKEMQPFSFITVNIDTYNKLQKHACQYENWDIFFEKVIKILGTLKQTEQ